MNEITEIVPESNLYPDLDAVLHFRCDRELKRALEFMAEVHNLTLSDYTRQSLKRVVGEDIKKHGLTIEKTVDIQTTG